MPNYLRNSSFAKPPHCGPPCIPPKHKCFSSRLIWGHLRKCKTCPPHQIVNECHCVTVFYLKLIVVANIYYAFYSNYIAIYVCKPCLKYPHRTRFANFFFEIYTEGGMFAKVPCLSTSNTKWQAHSANTQFAGIVFLHFEVCGCVLYTHFWIFKNIFLSYSWVNDNDEGVDVYGRKGNDYVLVMMLLMMTMAKAFLFHSLYMSEVSE